MDRNEARKLKTAGALLLICFGRHLVARLFSLGNRRISRPSGTTSGNVRFFRCPSGNTYYTETEGDDGLPVLVFIHGLNSDSRQWYYQRLFFRGRYRLVFIDLPGHGRSAPAKDLSIATLATDLGGLLDGMHLINPVLYGHSMGGNVVLEYCGKSDPQPAARGIVVHQSSYTNPLKTCFGASILYPYSKQVIVPFLNFIKRHSAFFWFLSYVNYLNGLSSLFFRFFFFTGRQSPSDYCLWGVLRQDVPRILQQKAFCRS